jgi:hypothetical protein
MRRRLLHPGFLCVLVAFVLPVSTLRAGGPVKAKSTAKAVAFAAEVTNLYQEFDLKEVGLSKKAFEYALKGYYYLLDRRWLNKTNIISICDMSQSSRSKRFYVLDLDQRKVLVNTYVAHGRNSGQEFARSFSNSTSSHKSSLGFFITQGTYFGNNGFSLRIRGMERGINDKAGSRNIVVHGSQYVGPDFLEMNQFCGRSYGCPAVPADESETIIDLIKEGSVLFIYHPTKKYTARSKILNS